MANPRRSRVQAMVSMMLPRLFVELAEVLSLKLAIELSTNDAMIACADSALVEDEVADVVGEALEFVVLPVKEVIKFWNAEVRLEVILLEAPSLPYKLESNCAFPDAVARLVSAATVDATFATELPLDLAALAAVPDTASEALNRLERLAAWPVTLPIDIISSLADA